MARQAAAQRAADIQEIDCQARDDAAFTEQDDQFTLTVTRSMRPLLFAAAPASTSVSTQQFTFLLFTNCRMYVIHCYSSIGTVARGKWIHVYSL